MEILALERDVEGVPLDAFTPERLKEEALRAWELHQQGIIRHLRFRADRHAAVLFLECDAPEEAQAFLDTLPLVREGLIAFELIPLAPYPGFARLFAEN